jgi:peroxin-3
MAHQQSSRRRNRPSVGAVVTTAAVAYGAYRLADWVWNQNREDGDGDGDVMNEERDHDAPPRGSSFLSQWLGGRPSQPRQQQHQLRWRDRRQRLVRCREETKKAMDNLLPTVRMTIEEATNTSRETKLLKKLRAQARVNKSDNGNEETNNNETTSSEEGKLKETQLWETIKTQAVTRMVATAYAHTILFLVLTVQVHLLGRKLFEEQQNSSLSSSSPETSLESYQDSHRLVLLKTYDYFFDQGISSLIQTVRRAVSRVFADWDVGNPSSLHMPRDLLDKALTSVREEVLFGTSGRIRGRPRSLLRFLLPPEDTTDHLEQDNALAHSILDETWDLLESPVLEDAQHDCLDTTFDLMRDSWGALFVATETDSEEGTQVTQPLAKVIAQFKHTSNSFYSKDGTSPGYYASLEKLACVLELGDVSFNLS